MECTKNRYYLPQPVPFDTLGGGLEEYGPYCDINKPLSINLARLTIECFQLPKKVGFERPFAMWVQGGGAKSMEQE